MTMPSFVSTFSGLNVKEMPLLNVRSFLLELELFNFSRDWLELVLAI